MINGVVPIYKEAGYSSFYYVNQLKKIFKQKKVGHIGTLDPSVTGILPICLGNATKLVESMMNKKKAYSCTILIGQATETEDLTGKVIATKKVEPEISITEIDLVLKSFKGENYQVPPFFSAVRYHGKHLYEYARNDIYIRKPSRLFEISNIFRTSSINWSLPNTCEFDFEVFCSKGTYIRTLCTQIGEKLGYPAVMKNLTRIASGGFEIDQAIPLSKLKKATNAQNFVIPLEQLLQNLPTRELTDIEFSQVKNGAPVVFDLNQTKVALKYQQKIIAIYRLDQGLYRADMMFLDNINENYKSKK